MTQGGEAPLLRPSKYAQQLWAVSTCLGRRHTERAASSRPPDDNTWPSQVYVYPQHPRYFRLLQADPGNPSAHADVHLDEYQGIICAASWCVYAAAAVLAYLCSPCESTYSTVRVLERTDDVFWGGSAHTGTYHRSGHNGSLRLP